MTTYQELTREQKVLYNAIVEILIRHDKESNKRIVSVLNKFVGLNDELRKS